MIVLGSFSLNRLSVISKTTADLYTHPFITTNSLKNMKISLLMMQVHMNEIRNTNNLTEIERLIHEISREQESFDMSSELVKSRYMGDSSDIAAIVAASERWKIARSKEIGLLQTGIKGEDLKAAAETVKATRSETFEKMATAISFALNKAALYNDNANSLSRSILYFIAIFLTVVIIVGALIAFFVTRSIVNPLAEIVKDVETISQGNLTLEIDIERANDEIIALKKSFRSMVRNLRTQTRETLDGVTLLAVSASQITATGTELASVAAETASSITETTVTAEEVKQTAQVAMERTKDVAESAENTFRISQEGQQSIDETLSGIRRIKEQMETIAKSILSLNEKSESIGEIISSVEDIAEQSNLLAVNAAIEAAKAGEQGRGFSVVAREIRSLAEQSRASTKQVKTILGDIQKAMQSAVMATELGNKIADNNYQKSEIVSSALHTLTGSIENTSQMAQQIMAANQQQFTGIGQVTLAMESIKEASRQNVDAARQLEGASRNLDSLSQKLKSVVERYKV
jgi:methyl-accepting chemotaxis protein